MKSKGLLVFTLTLVFGLSSTSYSTAAPKSMNNDFKSMPELLAAMKSRGIVCEKYEKTPAELVIEEGKCQFQGVEILIDLWKKGVSTKEFAKGMTGIPKVNIEYEVWPKGSKIFAFYMKNYNFSINGIAPDVAKSEKVAKLWKKKLGVPYLIGS